MPADTPRKRSPIWAMLLTVSVAWSVCAGYRWHRPPLVEARATVQIPAVIDLEALCRQPDLFAQAARQLQENDPEFLLLEPATEKYQLSGAMQARKLTRGEQASVQAKPDASEPRATPSGQHASVEMETWELSYQTHHAKRAVDELTAICMVLEMQISLAIANAEPHPSRVASPPSLKRLEEQVAATKLALQQLPVTDPQEATGPKEQGESLELSQTDALLEQSRDAEDWDIIAHEFQAHRQLGKALECIGPGPVFDAVQKLEQQRLDSAELTRLNATEKRLEEIYGDRHPKLIEVRKKFEHLLSQVGGWEAVIDQKQVAEQLQSLRETMLAEKKELVDDLALRLELEQSERDEAGQVAQQQAELNAQLKTAQHELDQVRAAERLAARGPVHTFQQIVEPHLANLPWFVNAGVLFGLATLLSLFAGRSIHRAWPDADEAEDTPPERTVAPVFVSPPVATLDLAQRRALRQARLKQAYA